MQLSIKHQFEKLVNNFESEQFAIFLPLFENLYNKIHFNFY